MAVASVAPHTRAAPQCVCRLRPVAYVRRFNEREGTLDQGQGYPATRGHPVFRGGINIDPVSPVLGPKNVLLVMHQNKLDLVWHGGGAGPTARPLFSSLAVCSLSWLLPPPSPTA